MNFALSFADRILRSLSRVTTTGRFIAEMDGLRFVAIAMVFLFHLNGYLTVKSHAYYPAPPADWLSQTARVGFRGVELFFVISGFILGLPFASHHLRGSSTVSLRKYYLRRLTRLEPPYFVTTTILFLLAILWQGANWRVLAPHLAASLSYMHNLIYGSASSVIGVAWSLEIEVQFYVLVPLLTLLFAIRNKMFRRGVILFVVVALLITQSIFIHESPRLSLSILAYLQFFLIGFLLADVYIVDWSESPSSNLYWDAVGVAVWPMLFLILRSATLAHWVFPELIFIGYAAAFRGRILNRIFVNRWITAIGGMCYSIYLIHYEVISAVARFTKKISEGAPYSIHLAIQAILVGVVVCIVCGLYFVILEKPCMRRDWPKRLWKAVQNLLVVRRGPLENEATD